MTLPLESARESGADAGADDAGDKRRLPKGRVPPPVLTKEEVAEIVGEAENSTLLLPLEHRYWTKEQLRLYVMSDGVVRPKGCSIPDQNLLVDRVVSEGRRQELLEKAADWIRRADGLLVGSGAGMGVGSGLATFRGGQGGVWPALKKLGLSYEDVCDPKWFTEDPRLAWGFWSFCHEAYREAEPHEGYKIVRKWAEWLPFKAFSFTSNIDGHWLRSGWPHCELCECHGAVRWLQCSVPCTDEVWDAPEDLDLQENPVTFRAEGKLPTCPHCGAVARPVVLMFGGDSGFSKRTRRSQQNSLDYWLYLNEVSAPHNPEPLLVCLELGCGVTVPTVRKELERAMERFPFAKLVRVNPENPGVAQEFSDRAVSLPMSATDALSQLDIILGEPEKMRLIVHDCYGGGKELDLPTSMPVHRILRRAMTHQLAEGDCGWEFHEGEEFAFLGVHILNRDVKKGLDGMQPVPVEVFMNVDGDEEPDAACIHIWGGHFTGRNWELEQRFGRIYRLIMDLQKGFEHEHYQQRLKEVADREQLRTMIKEVHLDVLPQHGFTVSERTTPGQWMMHQQRMQAFIMSGDWWSELLGLSTGLQGLSGVDRMAGLPAKAKPKARR